MAISQRDSLILFQITLNHKANPVDKQLVKMKQTYVGNIDRISWELFVDKETHVRNIFLTYNHPHSLIPLT